MSTIYGYAGKMLRVNLTTGEMTVLDTLQYKDYLGGMGIGYKVLYDEVPIGTHAYDEAAKVVFAVGPMTGAGGPSSSRTNITCLSPFTKGSLIVDGHMGGDFGMHLKYAGWDGVIIEGKAEKPVYLKLDDDKYSLEDASTSWGKGTIATCAVIGEECGKDFCTAAIGPAGENLVPLSCVINSRSHSAGGGTGAALGAKNFKAITVRGTKAVRVADPKKIMELNELFLGKIIGSQMEAMVPLTPQPWSEFTSTDTTWTSREGLTWGAAEGEPIESGICPPGDINKIGLRVHKPIKFMGPLSETMTVKQVGCGSCPLHCNQALKVKRMQDIGYPAVSTSVCMPVIMWTNLLMTPPADYEQEGDGKIFAHCLASTVADDLGLWDNYSEIPNGFRFLYKSGMMKEWLSEEEWNDIPWDLMEKGDPMFIKDIMERIAYKKGELSKLGDGAYYLTKDWTEENRQKYMNGFNLIWSPLGWARHHGNDHQSQVGALANSVFNRDPMIHTVRDMELNGLPYEIQKSIIEELIGGECWDKRKCMTPMNPYKAKLARYTIIKSKLHDMLAICNWTWGNAFSPLKERGYKGDMTLEAQYMSAIMGEEYTEESLDFYAERVFQLHRALTVKEMGTMDMRNEHDKINDWVYDHDPDFKPFDEGTYKLDRDDMKLAFDMFYEEMGWDVTTGAPTRKTLEHYGLGYVADDLEKLGLLPG